MLRRRNHPDSSSGEIGMATEDTDITIGPGKLLGLFFMLVTICGVFFAIGYSLGKTSAREQAMNDKTPLSVSLSENT